MIHGRVIGELWATVRLESLAGRKLLIVRPEGPAPTEDLVAVDLVGAGRRERVVVALGRAARNALGAPEAAIEAAVVAIIDDLDIDASAGAGPDSTPGPPDEPPEPPDESPEPPETESAAKPGGRARGRAAKAKARKAAPKTAGEKAAATEEPKAERTRAAKAEGKAPARKKAGARAKAAAPEEDDLLPAVAAEETADLFGVEESEPAAAAEEPIDYVVERDEDALPGFEDVDAIWGEDDEEARS